jgi:hypothetical protein
MKLTLQRNLPKRVKSSAGADNYRASANVEWMLSTVDHARYLALRRRAWVKEQLRAALLAR